VGSDKREAVYWFRKAAVQGHTVAQAFLQGSFPSSTDRCLRVVASNLRPNRYDVATEPAKHLRLGVNNREKQKETKRNKNKKKTIVAVHLWAWKKRSSRILSTSAREGNEDEHAGSGEAEGRIAIHHSMESRQRAQDSTPKANETPNRRG
jgi:hypothetical protein